MMMGKLGDGSVQLSNANGSGGAPHMIDQNTFTQRLQALYLHWNKYKDVLWGSADFYAVASPPPPTEDTGHIKSLTFNDWLLGYEFPDTIMVFGRKQIHFLCSQDDASLLESVKGFGKEAVDVDVVIHTKLEDDDGTSKIDAVFHSIRMSKSEADATPIVGYLMDESVEGSLLEKWADKLKTSGLKLCDVTDAVFEFFAVKDLYELIGPVLNKFEPIRLSDLHMYRYPPFSEKNLTGTLEAHANGFRYSTSGQDDERVDIMLANIKHAFFQPKETQYPILHFHLHYHMVVGNKKTKDFQFFIKVQSGVTYDLNEEQMGRVKSKNMEFQNFVNRVHDGLDLEFEQPQFEQGFHGQPTGWCLPAFFVPTKSCLVELTELPSLVITLSEIAIVNLERIRRYIWGQKEQERQENFDMVIVFKDKERDVFLIHSIQATSLEGIEAWLKTCAGIKSHKSSLNLDWRSILDAFRDDGQVFEKAGGWDFLSKNDCDLEFELSSSSRCDSMPMPASGDEMPVPNATRNTRWKKRTCAVQKSEGTLGRRIMVDRDGCVEIVTPRRRIMVDRDGCVEICNVY